MVVIEGLTRVNVVKEVVITIVINTDRSCVCCLNNNNNNNNFLVAVVVVVVYLFIYRMPYLTNKGGLISPEKTFISRHKNPLYKFLYHPSNNSYSHTQRRRPEYLEKTADGPFC